MAHPNIERMAASDGCYPGGWITIPDASVVETMFQLPYDHVGIDCQHTMIDVAMATRMLLAAPKGGPAALIRVPSNNMADINKALDGGADGVIVPMVNTGAEARAAVASCRYAPEGVRSFGPMRPGMGFDIKQLAARASCFVMAETVEAVKNIEEIASTPGLAGIYVGPADLSITLGVPIGQNPMPQPLIDAVTKIADACKRHKLIASGFFGAPFIPVLREIGFRMFTVGSDRGYMAAGGAAELRTIKSGK